MASEEPGSLLIQFARAPIVGRVKTRMVPALSPEQACDLHCRLVLRTSGMLVRAALGPVHLAVAGDLGYPLFRECLELGVSSLEPQRGVDLGQRMYHAIDRGLDRYSRVVLVGSDCPDLDAGYLARAVAGLNRVPVVLGPANDGGYVLVAVRVRNAQMFREIPWGTPEVLEATRRRLQESGVAWIELESLADIDRPEDLAGWQDLLPQP
jgi:rSAM/selenodomain-associated transferase 1